MDCSLFQKIAQNKQATRAEFASAASHILKCQYCRDWAVKLASSLNPNYLSNSQVLQQLDEKLADEEVWDMLEDGLEDYHNS